MKIVICGSMHFAKEMMEAQRILKEIGHEATIPSDTELCVARPELSENLEHCQTFNDLPIDKYHFNIIEKSDAIVVLNYPKNGLDGYVGGATLMEIAIARHFDKKIFLLHELPPENELRYALEIKLCQPVMLNGDISKIKDYA